MTRAPQYSPLQSPCRSDPAAPADSDARTRAATATQTLGVRIARILGGLFRLANGQADVSRPLVREIERLAHVEVQDSEPPSQILERPDDRVLRLDRRPLTELVVAEIRLQRLADLAGEMAVGFL